MRTRVQYLRHEGDDRDEQAALVRVADELLDIDGACGEGGGWGSDLRERGNQAAGS